MKGRVTLDIPPLVENGNSVPLTVKVDSPMTAAGFREDHRRLQRTQSAAERRHFPSQPTGRPSHRVHPHPLGDSQNIVAIAQLSDGTFWSDKAELIVTLPACVES